MEYFDWRIEPDQPVEEYQVYKWACVDCDECEELAETMQIAQWPTFMYGKHELTEGDKPCP